jgi:hypothetical protein
MIPRRGRAVNQLRCRVSAMSEAVYWPPSARPPAATGEGCQGSSEDAGHCNFIPARTYYYACAESDHKRLALCRGHCICQKYCTATAAAAIIPRMHASVSTAAHRLGRQPPGRPHDSPASSALHATPITPSTPASAWFAGAHSAQPCQRSRALPRHDRPPLRPRGRWHAQATRVWRLRHR